MNPKYNFRNIFIHLCVYIFTDNTKGLLGKYNSDPTDDFTSRDGYVLRQGLPAQSIHTNFGLSCKFTSGDFMTSVSNRAREISGSVA